jgi:hypothetical protein
MNYIKVMIFLAVFTSITANAANSSNAYVVCPATIISGAQLNGITGNVLNDDPNNPLIIKSKVVSITGNSGSGTVGLQGPFVLSIASTLIPAATLTTELNVPNQPQYGTHTVVTASSRIFAFNFATVKSPANTLAVVTVGVIDDANKLHVVGSCPITVK